jgi:four helix bundle protein
LRRSSYDPVHPPGRIIEEGRAGESRADFVHKLSICLKELRESRFWLRLTIRSNFLPKMKMNQILDECEQLTKILGKSITTAKSHATKRRINP